MGATGFLIIIVCVIRAFYDDPKYFPLSEKGKVFWGLAAVFGAGLCTASIFMALWSGMP